MENATRRTTYTEFDRKVDEWVARALDGGVQPFDELLRRLPGVYPSVARQSLLRLSEGEEPLKSAAREILSRFGLTRGEAARVDLALPPPHPLEFEWRFTDGASDLLLDMADSLTAVGGTIVLFGTPGVARRAMARSLQRAIECVGPENPVTRRLIDLNAQADGRLHIVTNTSASEPSQSDVVVLDPPWYDDFVHPMLFDAAARCRAGGYILMSAPPEGTRPSASADFDATLRFAERLGLRPVEHLRAALEYETPYFEANALFADGIHAPQTWRIGDLVKLTKREQPDAGWKRRSPVECGWREVQIGRMRTLIRSARASANRRGGALSSLVEGDVLPSVSRRDSRREMAQVWTSGNRIFASNRPDLVIAAARNAAEMLGAASAVERADLFTPQEQEEIARVGLELLHLAGVEGAEERGERGAEASKWGARYRSNSSVLKRGSGTTSSG